MILAHGAIPLEPGDCVRAPPGVAHGVRNPQSDGDLRILLIFIAR
jgi:mannose-6-phosphate isomerase-like protein (cupin superfamily)